MQNKFKYVTSILQIIAGILAAIVFAKNIIYGGKIEMTLISLIVMILGIVNGFRCIRDINNSY